MEYDLNQEGPLPSGDFLVSAGDDEISVVHCDEIGCELAREVVLLFKVLPVDIRIGILGLLEGMSYCTLQYSMKVVICKSITFDMSSVEVKITKCLTEADLCNS